MNESSAAAQRRPIAGGLIQLQKDTAIAGRVGGAPLTRLERFQCALLKGFVENHACLGARSVLKSGAMYVSVQRDMHTVESAFRTLEDLHQYYGLSDLQADTIKTLAIVFVESDIASQLDFEQRYWKFAQLLHDIDGIRFPYDPTVSPDPTAADFELSLAGRAVFTTTLNPKSPRISRRTPYAVWVMNQLSQFNALRTAGKFADWQKSIRRDDALVDPSGTHNPILVEHGYASAASQLPGSGIEPCPFQPRLDSAAKINAAERVLSRAYKEDCPEAITAELAVQLARFQAREQIGSAAAGGGK